MTLNLLTEPIFTVDAPDGARAHASLPEVLDRLAREVPTDFGAVQAHQLQSWESLLIQLGALATDARGGQIPDSVETWRDALLVLTNGDDASWCLVVDDIARPAFMQPPLAGKDYRDPKKIVDASDLLDMLVTSKNHDVKLARAARSRPEHWVFALVSLQTSDGFAGRDNYGIARMNGGYGSRPSLGVTTGLGLAARFRRDLNVWNERRGKIAQGFGMAPEGGAALLWTLPWDGDSSLTIEDLDPCFIEVCRPVRLGLRDGKIIAWKSSSRARRVDAEARKGELGDIWIPVKRGDERTAFTAGGNGFSYKVVSELLLGTAYDRAAAMELRPDDRGDVTLLARVLPRGQGKTQGLFERVLPLPEKARAVVFGEVSRREALAKQARDRVEDVAKVQNKVLHPALCALLQAIAEGQKLDLTDDRTQRWKGEFDAHVDQAFFPQLWEDLDLALARPDDARARWQRTLVDLAWGVFQGAVDAVPLPSVRRYRARAIAERVFKGSAFKNFPDAMKLRAHETHQEVSP
jgi:CRISPR system Cascade subunit CasA